MTLEDNIRELRESLIVTSAQTLRHEQRLKEHQQWLEENEAAYARHRTAMAEVDENITRLSAAQLVTEEKLRNLIDVLRGAGNGHQ